MGFLQSSVQLWSFYFLWWIVSNHVCKHVPFWELSILYQLDKELYKLIVLIRTILVANNRKPSNSRGSKDAVTCHWSPGQDWGLHTKVRQPLSSSFASLFMSLAFYLICLLLTFFTGLLCLHGKKTWLFTGPHLSFSFIVLVTCKEMDLLIFSYQTPGKGL